MYVFVKYLILLYDYAFILATLPLSMYRHISLSKLHTPYVDMKMKMKLMFQVVLLLWFLPSQSTDSSTLGFTFISHTIQSNENTKSMKFTIGNSPSYL